METNSEKKVLAAEALKALSEIEETIKIEHIVKDNKIEFKVNEVDYRLRKPTYSESIECGEQRRKKYLEFMKDDSYMFRKQWVDSYKKKGIDIAEMENKVRLSKHDMEASMLRLATTQDPKTIQQLKNEILKYKDEQFSISIQITDLLAYSIEEQLNIFNLSYITYTVFEKKDGAEWTKVFPSYEEFRSSELKATQYALMYISYLIYDVEAK